MKKAHFTTATKVMPNVIICLVLAMMSARKDFSSPNCSKTQADIIARKLSYFGHVTRHHCLEKTIIQGMVVGKCRRGRPAASWLDDIKKLSGMKITEATNYMADPRGRPHYNVDGILLYRPHQHMCMQCELERERCKDSRC